MRTFDNVHEDGGYSGAFSRTIWQALHPTTRYRASYFIHVSLLTPKDHLHYFYGAQHKLAIFAASLREAMSMI